MPQNPITTEVQSDYQNKLQQLIDKMAQLGHPIKIVPNTGGGRSADEQRKDYEAGKSQLSGEPGKESSHQLGVGNDLMFQEDTKGTFDKKNLPYDLLVKTAKEVGLTSGADFGALGDFGHVEHPTFTKLANDKKNARNNDFSISMENEIPQERPKPAIIPGISHLLTTSNYDIPKNPVTPDKSIDLSVRPSMDTPINGPKEDDIPPPDLDLQGKPIVDDTPPPDLDLKGNPVISSTTYKKESDHPLIDAWEKPFKDLGNRVISGVKDTGKFIGDLITPSTAVPTAFNMAKSAVTDIGHIVNPFPTADPTDKLSHAFSLVGGNPENLKEDFKNRSFGGMLGDVAVPAGLALLGSKAHMGDIPAEINPIEDLRNRLKNTTKVPPSDMEGFDIQSHVGPGPGFNGEVDPNTVTSGGPGPMAADRMPTTWQSIRNKLKNSEPINQDEAPVATQVINDAVKDIKNPIQKQNLFSKVQDNLKSFQMGYNLFAPGVHGLGLISHPMEYFGSFDDMFKAWGSQKATDVINQSIIDHPSGYFKDSIDPTTGESVPAIANKLKLYGLNSETPEFFKNDNWVTRNLPGIKRGSNAYSTFLNKVKSDVAVNLIDQLKREDRFSQPVVDQIMDQLNISTGSANWHGLDQGMIAGQPNKAAQIAMNTLNGTFFAPSLNLSRIQMYNRVFNPFEYAGRDPIARNEAWKSLGGVIGTGIAINELSRLVGATVTSDPTSSDFMKARFGNSTIDNFAGLQQYPVNAWKFIYGKSTNRYGKTSDLSNPKYGGSDREDVIRNFLDSKLNVIPSFIDSWARGKQMDGTPFNLKQEIYNRTAPIIVQDLTNLWLKNPELSPFGKVVLSPAPVFGIGTHTYGR